MGGELTVVKVNSVIDEFSSVMQSSNVYNDYKLSYAEIKSNDRLLNKVKQFRLAQVNFESKLLKNERPSFHEEQHLCSLYAELSLNDLAITFLENESKLLMEMENIQNSICESSGLDLSFYDSIL